MRLFRGRKDKAMLYPDEVFLDAGNLPQFNTQQFEGVIERPIEVRVMIILGVFFSIFFVIFLGKIFTLQYIQGAEFTDKSANNSLRHSAIFTDRGVIYDALGNEIAWNNPEREYSDYKGLGHVLGYVGYPTQDEIDNESCHPKDLIGRSGVEKLYDVTLHGTNGLKIVEVDVEGTVMSESVLDEPRHGESITLSIDQRVQQVLYNEIRSLAREKNFLGGSGVIMNIQTGEVLAMTNYPEYDPNVLSCAVEDEIITDYQTDKRKPFLNRAVQGLYIPGSIFKPFVAVAALNENVINPEKVIYTEGQLSIPNPYYPDKFSIFRDWKNHGPVNMTDALAHSSNVYFFQIGGGYENQKGLGIDKIEKYSMKFGFGATTGIGFDTEEAGLIPSPAWKESTQNDVWRIGDTYNTSIGQYSFQVTPLQVVRGIAAIASDGKLVTPTLISKEDNKAKQINIEQKHFDVVKKGMRKAVTEGTAGGLSMYGVQVAAKTGTAEIDYGKKYVNSWVTGFFPYDDPKYAFAVVMEKGSRENYIGGVFVMRQVIEWIRDNTPEYIH